MFSWLESDTSYDEFHLSLVFLYSPDSGSGRGATEVLAERAHSAEETAAPPGGAAKESRDRK